MYSYLLSNLYLIWLILTVVCLIAELMNGDLYLLCFAVGAVGAMLAAAMGLPLWGQVFVWVIISLVCILFIRKPLLRRLYRGKERKSNADALIGRTGLVTEAVPAKGYGYVKIDGDEWRCVVENGEAISRGTKAVVVKRDSIILTIKKADD